MKNQTVVAPKATVGMKDAVRTWLSSDNKLFTFLMERRVTNRQMLLLGHAMVPFSQKNIECFCHSKENLHLCIDFHFMQARTARQITLLRAFFMLMALLYTHKVPTPVWSVNAPTACIRWKSTGKRSLSSFPVVINLIVSF